MTEDKQLITATSELSRKEGWIAGFFVGVFFTLLLIGLVLWVS